jgi:copper(I)-binding protein
MTRKWRGETEMGNNAWLFKGWFKDLPLLIALFFVAVGLGACSRAPHIEVEQQEARLSPALLGVCSIFLRIENSGNGSDRLVSAQVDIPGTITELHDVKEGKMTKREEIPIPAKSTVTLRPGGLHIMVVKLPGDVRVGYEFRLRLVFERSGEKLVSVGVVR